MVLPAVGRESDETRTQGRNRMSAHNRNVVAGARRANWTLVHRSPQIPRETTLNTQPFAGSGAPSSTAWRHRRRDHERLREVDGAQRVHAGLAGRAAGDCAAALTTKAEHDAAVHNVRAYFGRGADAAAIERAWGETGRR